MSSTTTLHQDVIPGQPSSVLVRKYSLEVVHKMKADLLHATLSQGAPCCAVGVSVGLTTSGAHIRSIVLATRDHVFHLVLHHQPTPAQKGILRRLLSKISCLTGFEFPYTVTLLAHTLGGVISGHDLSTITLNSKEQGIMTAGTLIRAGNSSASARRIDEQWDSGYLCSDAKSTEAVEPDYCLRAWITAMCVSIFQYLCLKLPNYHFQRCQHGSTRITDQSAVEH